MITAAEALKSTVKYALGIEMLLKFKFKIMELFLQVRFPEIFFFQIKNQATEFTFINLVFSFSIAEDLYMLYQITAEEKRTTNQKN